MENRIFTLILFATVLLFSSCDQQSKEQAIHSTPDYALVIHGGAGNLQSEDIPEEMKRAYKASLKKALEAGEQVLKNDGTAMNAVIAAIVIMENDSLFNSAKGAVLTEDGEVELDASLMRGEDANAGAVAGVKHVKNPILAAKEVMLNSKHVMLAGQGADYFAALKGLDTVPQEYFITSHRLRQHQKAIKGTVGAAAIDKKGRLAAGTSTGGMSMKKWGRIGDSPVIGAGTYADNRTCAVSGTGHGEYFIRNAVAFDIHARMLYKKQNLKSAAKTVIHDILSNKYKADGGIIGVDTAGNIVMEHNTSAMFRAFIKSSGEKDVLIF
ncbi:MAG: isoaspartyl peptidase/L-asparaginase [Bacteroidales bacterium]|nr:isoaspartyl peptidase/L-asparaginase [Bacteroidales bacterium]